MRKETEVVIIAAKEAGAQILPLFRTLLAAEFKEDRSPVTEGDFLADRVIRHHLLRAFSEYGAS